MKLPHSCLYCGSGTRAHWPGTNFTRCKSCGLVMLDPFPTLDELDELYLNSWEAPEVNINETGNADEVLVAQYISELKKSLGVASLQGLRILDFGAGRGALMTGLTEAGVETYGVEPYGLNALEELGLTGFKDLSELPSDLKFDGIITMDVAEHLTTPWKTFEQLYDRLKPDGWLLISTPSPSGLNARLSRGNWREVKKAGHILFMDDRTLSIMLNDAGFSSVRSLNWNTSRHLGAAQRLSHFAMRSAGLFGAARVLTVK